MRAKLISTNQLTNNKYFFKVFIDTGKGFNEKQTIIQSIRGKINSWENEEIAEYDNIRKLKIAPINAKSIVKLEYLGLEGMDEDDYTLEHNAYFVEDNIYYFDTDYPEITLTFKKKSYLGKLLTTLEY